VVTCQGLRFDSIFNMLQCRLALVTAWTGFKLDRQTPAKLVIKRKEKHVQCTKRKYG
jgi:hypothetical protein